MGRLVALLLVLAGCPKPVCLRGETRCTGDRAEICLADRTWGLQQDCDLTSHNSNGRWVCCAKPRPTGNGATCVPEAVCQ